MRSQHLSAAAFTLIAGFLLVLPHAQAGGDKKKKFQIPKSARPGKEHKQLKSMVGNWKAEGKMYSETGKEPTAFAGKLKRNMILKGRFLQEKYAGDFFGQKFQGLGLLGYDRVNKKYVNIWLDSMSTSVFSSEGKLDPKTNTIVLLGTSYDPDTEKPIKLKTVVKIVSNDQQVFSMYGMMGDKSIKMMEITYTRAPGGKKKKKGN